MAAETKPLLVIDVVGLTPGLVGADTPRLFELAGRGSLGALECPFPALTLSSQASMLTGAPPSEHGIVGNGWWFDDLAEILFWRQPHALLQREDLPTRLRRERPGLRVLKHFWWFNMYAPVDLAVTPRPMYPADGRKIPDVHTHPARLRDELQERFGRFPLFKFWGPLASLPASRWIADSARWLIEAEEPDLSLVYLPHLDYDFQRFGPDDPRSRAALREVDALCGELIDQADARGTTVVITSEYGIEPVSRAIHPNRALREAGLLAVREELGLERLDAGASAAFAVSDHQIAHVHVRDEGQRARVAEILGTLDGVERVLTGPDLADEGLSHPRSGDLVLVAEPDAWFTYYFWLDDARAPDYARTVDIHRKPGYDPAELVLDPALRAPKLRVARRLLAKKLGFRTLLDVIGLDPSVVRGSHGRRAATSDRGPLVLSSVPRPELSSDRPLPLARFPGLLEDLLFDR